MRRCIRWESSHGHHCKQKLLAKCKRYCQFPRWALATALLVVLSKLSPRSPPRWHPPLPPGPPPPRLRPPPLLPLPLPPSRPQSCTRQGKGRHGRSMLSAGAEACLACSSGRAQLCSYSKRGPAAASAVGEERWAAALNSAAGGKVLKHAKPARCPCPGQPLTLPAARAAAPGAARKGARQRSSSRTTAQHSTYNAAA